MNKAVSIPSFQISGSNSKHYLILFLIWPFLAFITALFNYSHREAKKVVYIFLVYYGLTFALGGDTSDSIRYAMRLATNAELPFSEFFNVIKGLYNSKTMDIAEPLISFFVSRFTSYHGVYFAVWAAIFGYFYLKTVNLLYAFLSKNRGLNAIIFLTFFIIIIPITYINGVRMYTAAWIFFYGAYYVVLYRKSKYLLIALAASLVHWSFFAANAVLIVYFILGNRKYVYLSLALASFAIPQLLTPIFQKVSRSLGGGFQRRFEGYTSESYVLSRQEGFEQYVWFMRLGPDLVLYFLLLAIVFIQLKYAKLMDKQWEKNLFNFTLLFLAFRNFGMTIPSFGLRFTSIFLLFATMYVFFYMLKLQDNKIHFLTWIGLFPMLLMTAINFRLGASTINAWLFTPGFGLPIFVHGLPIADLLFP